MIKANLLVFEMKRMINKFKGKGQGWHEPADQTGKAPEHVAAANRAATTDVLRSPMIIKDFNYFMRKFNLIPKTDRRVKAKGRIQREYSVEGNQKTSLVINEDTEVTRWHEVGHLVAEDIAKQEFRKGGEMVLLTSLRTFQITDEEYKIISTMMGREELDVMPQLEEDVKKIKNSIPPYDKIPESEKGRIVKQYKEHINMIEKKINHLKKSTEVFANFFAIYQINRESSISLLPRLYNQWGNIIDTYMRDA